MKWNRPLKLFVNVHASTMFINSTGIYCTPWTLVFHHGHRLLGFHCRPAYTKWNNNKYLDTLNKQLYICIKFQSSSKFAIYNYTCKSYRNFLSIVKCTKMFTRRFIEITSCNPQCVVKGDKMGRRYIALDADTALNNNPSNQPTSCTCIYMYASHRNAAACTFTPNLLYVLAWMQRYMC